MSCGTISATSRCLPPLPPAHQSPFCAHKRALLLQTTAAAANNRRCCKLSLLLQVLRACALTVDFAIMPLGDGTIVAEKGISLSGGQRSRVALARDVCVNPPSLPSFPNPRAGACLCCVCSTFTFALHLKLSKLLHSRVLQLPHRRHPISALDDQTQEHVWTQLFEGLLKHATIIVGSSRLVISCTAVLNLMPHGMTDAATGITRFDGCVDFTASSAALPFRYTRAQAPAASAAVAVPSSPASSKSSDVAVAVVQPSPTFRSRISSFQITLEEVRV